MQKRITIASWVNVTLLLPEMEDLDVMLQWINNIDTAISAWRNSPTFYPRWREEEWLKEKIKDKSPFFVIQENDTQEVIWWIEITELDEWNKKWALGITIYRDDLRGKWYWTEAIKLILEICFVKYGFNKVYLFTSSENKGWQKAYKNAGFQECGILKKDRYVSGKYEDTVIMEILSTEFKK